MADSGRSWQDDERREEQRRRFGRIADSGRAVVAVFGASVGLVALFLLTFMALRLGGCGLPSG